MSRASVRRFVSTALAVFVAGTVTDLLLAPGSLGLGQWISRALAAAWLALGAAALAGRRPLAHATPSAVDALAHAFPRALAAGAALAAVLVVLSLSHGVAMGYWRHRGEAVLMAASLGVSQSLPLFVVLAAAAYRPWRARLPAAAWPALVALLLVAGFLALAQYNYTRVALGELSPERGAASTRGFLEMFGASPGLFATLIAVRSVACAVALALERTRRSLPRRVVVTCVATLAFSVGLRAVAPGQNGADFINSGWITRARRRPRASRWREPSIRADRTPGTTR